MDMGFDRERRLPALAGNHSGGSSDWYGLRARLAAGYAARPVLERPKAQKTPVKGGSFDRFAARMLAFYGRDPSCRLGGINPTALGNGKWTHDYDATVAGALTAGD